jgi:hypothetical protein
MRAFDSELLYRPGIFGDCQAGKGKERVIRETEGILDIAAKACFYFGARGPRKLQFVAMVQV